MLRMVWPLVSSMGLAACQAEMRRPVLEQPEPVAEEDHQGARPPRGQDADSTPAASRSGGDPVTVEASAPPDAAGPDTSPPADALGLSGDAAAPEAGRPPPCTARFCDDFESWRVGTAPAGAWQVSRSSTATVLVDSTQAFTGRQSVRMTTPAVVGRAFLRLATRRAFPLPTNNMFGRMMIRLTKAPPVGSGMHWSFVEAPGQTSTGTDASYYLGANPKVFLVYHGDYAKMFDGPHDCGKRSATLFPEGRWVCLQWQFDGSTKAGGGARDEVRVWLDGALVTDAVVIGKGAYCSEGNNAEWVAPTFTELFVGWQAYDGRAPFPIELWLDDVAVDEKPIACPQR